MSVTTVNPIEFTYTASGSTDTFQVGHRFFANSDLDVYLTPNGDTPDPVADLQQLNVDYTVSGAGDESGGSITFATTPSSGDRVDIWVDIPETRTYDFSGGTFTETEVNRQLDKLTFLIQQVDAKVENRALLYPANEDVDDGNLILPKLSALQIWSANGDGDLIASTIEESSGWSTFRSEIANATQSAPGAALVGYYDSTHSLGQTTVDAYLKYYVTQHAWKTGNVKFTFGTPDESDLDDGWVWLRDKSIGDASSGATERANADTFDLFEFLWDRVSDSYCPVSGGRGTSATDDFAAHKTLTLPRTLGRVIGIAGAGSGLTSRADGQYLGEEGHALSKAELTPHPHTYRKAADKQQKPEGSGQSVYYSLTTTDTGDGSDGGLQGAAHNTMQPSIFLNAMIKL